MFELCARTYDPGGKATLRLVQGIFRTFAAAPWRAWRDCGGGALRKTLVWSHFPSRQVMPLGLKML
jgi:hypothetical protein